MANKIMTDYGGEVPCDAEALFQFDGVGEKTINILLNEAFGFFFGIGVDKHVFELGKAFGLVSEPVNVSLSTVLVEASLRQWIPRYKFTETNPIFGSWAQHFTQVLSVAPSGATIVDFRKTCWAIYSHFHRPYHLQMIFWMIAATRRHYKNK
jgi:endonuclease-3